MMFRNVEITDFQAVLETIDASGLEQLKVLIEVKRESVHGKVIDAVRDAVKHVFEVTASVEVLPAGTLAAEFEKSTKAPRFVDRRV